MRLYLAGAEAWTNLLLDLGVKYQLFSFFYLRTMMFNEGAKVRSMFSRMRKAKAKGYSFMLDSGAFTYQMMSNAGRPVPDVAKYFEEYKRFCLDYGDLFDIIIEFDVDHYVAGLKTEQVDTWTNDLLAQPSLAQKIMPVYHNHRGEKWLRAWLADTSSPFIAVGSAAANEQAASLTASSTAGWISSFIANAHRFGKWVHGLAYTRIRTDMKYTNFDSVDSTTWLRADKYGGSCYFINDKFIVLDHKHKADRAKYKMYYERWKLDFDKIMKDDLHENRKATIIAWRELANSFERKWAFQGAKYPYMYQLAQDNRVPLEHPLITKLKQERANGNSTS